MSKKIEAPIIDAPYDSKRIETEITVGEANQLRGVGTHIHMRPNGILNIKDPNNDLAILIS